MIEKLPETSPDGILLVDKEEGKSSFNEVRMVRRILKNKKAGHAGTLDPFATGLLIILLGQGTKLSPYIMGGEKKYRAEISLGVETDTGDPTGSVINKMPVREIGADKLTEAIARFTGVIEQVPPAFSALKVNGQRAYKLARKGIEVELKKREVTVYSIEIIDIRIPLLIIEVSCSAGTYIRSLASDLGRELGTVAHLKNLRRLSVGLFNVEDALALKNLDNISSGTLLDRIIPLKDAIPAMKAVTIDDQVAKKVRNGYRPSFTELIKKIDLPDRCDENIKLITESGLVAVMEVEKSTAHGNGRLKKVKVFH